MACGLGARAVRVGSEELDKMMGILSCSLGAYSLAMCPPSALPWGRDMT